MPPPVRNPIPILIGGGGEKVTLRITAQHGKSGIWSVVRRFRARPILDEHCRAIGRDPSEIERSVNVEVEDTYDPPSSTLSSRLAAPTSSCASRTPGTSRRSRIWLRGGTSGVGREGAGRGAYWWPARLVLRRCVGLFVGAF